MALAWTDADWVVVRQTDYDAKTGEMRFSRAFATQADAIAFARSTVQPGVNVRIFSIAGNGTPSVSLTLSAETPA